MNIAENISDMAKTINNVYDRAYNQGVEHSINQAIVILKRYQAFFDSVNYREVIEKIEALKTS